ncbi:hypothetical protein [Chengkuizengella marina]|nr:hypothetical protein [Chengkuizengella marina]
MEAKRLDLSAILDLCEEALFRMYLASRINALAFVEYLISSNFLIIAL